MDPVTGIGLVASVVQLVSFGVQTFKTCRQIQHGSYQQHEDLDSTSKRLAELTEPLKASLQQRSHPRQREQLALAKEEKNLLEVSQQCHDCARKLQDEIRKLQAQPGDGRVDVARKAARAIFKKDRLKEIQSQLERYQAILETSLLHRLRSALCIFFSSSRLLHAARARAYNLSILAWTFVENKIPLTIGLVSASTRKA